MIFLIAIPPMTAIKDAANLGPKSALWLAKIGITELEQVAAIGSIEVMLRLKRAGLPVSLNILYALEGALAGCHWQQVKRERRGELVLLWDAALAHDAAVKQKPGSN
ncbi:TfoX/Sxy family DNA transformation protein [Shewanella sp. JM162201]|uniref:TfoX/Sxy family DNA transformation protein n=1 Tax=Shewanella jiangmenensis TaxID=2837387 RepID=A0ABS5V3B7_9GAMM|nr:TfoX/Sxy family protein [Shewanella jiangmenensis]MBT1444915.1 TfoX/Sxy family DNA transformation protein [Shewanella jiangmenensis]